MIKTVFYFTGTELEYIALHRAGEISPNTIVLCKDTHSLWRNGERYGIGSVSGDGDYVPYDDTALTERIDQIVEELQELTEQVGQYEKGMTDEEKQLMQDLADQLIVIGDGLDTANEVAAAEKERLNGLLDGIQQSIDDMAEQAEQDNASIQLLVSDVQNQAATIQEHAEWILNREEEDYTSWKSGWNANVEAYLQEVGVWARDNGITETQFTQLSQSVDTISSSVNNLQEDVETVKTQFSNISLTANSIETRVSSVEEDLDTKATKSQVSELTQTVNGFDTRVSNVETDVAGKVGNTEFSTLSQRVNSIDLAVLALTPSEDGSISDQMQAAIELAVRDDVAELNLSSTYAKKSTEDDLAATQLDLENAEKVLEWMYSGLKLSTDPDKTTSELASAGKDALNSAISDLRTYVQKLKDGDYVASASITSAVNNAIASLYSQSGDNNAKSLIFSKITSNENSISGLLNDVSNIDDTVELIQSDLSDGLNQINQNTQDISAIVTAATGDSTSATIATKFSNWKSGLASKSDVENATASLVSSDVFENTVADLVTKTELNQATSTLAAKTTVENQGTRLSSVETKADQNAATLTNLTKTDGRIAKVEQKATDTEAAISGLVDASTDTVTASKIWESLANDDSVISSMRSQFATTVDGDGIASIVKEDIAQSVHNSTWDQWVSYMKGDVATAVNNYQTATANKAQWDAVVAYVDGKKTAIESIDDLDGSVSDLSSSLAGVSSSVESLEDEVTGIKNNYAQSSMFASIKDTLGKVTAASIVAAVNGSTGASKVQIDADHIDVSGVLTVANNAASAADAAQSTADSALAAATTIDGASIKTGTINTDRLDVSKIVGKINSSTGDSKLVINADHVDVSGVLTIANNATTAANAAQSTANSAANAASAAQSTANDAIAATTTIDGGNIKTGTIAAARIDVDNLEVKKLKAANSTTATNVTTVNGDGVTVKQGNNIGFQANADGSGSAAKGNISWTTDGTLSVNGAITATSLSLGNNASIAASKVTGLKPVATSGNYTDLSNKPTIPTKVSDLTNDSAFITSSALLEYAKTRDVPTKVSQLTNDSAFITNAALSGYATNQSVQDAVDNCLTQDDLTGYVKSSDLDGYVETNVGLGNASSGSYFLISNNGLLTANNAVITGQVSATSGAIGGILIGNNNIASTNGNFSVTDGGVLTAKSGTVGGWTLGNDYLSSGSDTSYVAINSAPANKNAYAMWAGNATAANAPFSVTKAGALKASSADITGAIHATSLVIDSGAQSAITGITNSLYRDKNTAIGSSDLTTALSNTISGKMDSSSFTQGNIIKAINGNTNTTTIDGGKITTGSITADKIAAGAITTNTLTASKVIDASQGVNSNTKVDGNGVQIYFTREGISGKSGRIELNADGSGYLAASNISWDRNGGFNLTSGSSGRYIRYNPTDGYLDAVISSLEVDNGVIIGGDTSINGELSVSDATIGSIETTGNVSIGGDLEVSGTISGSFGALSATSVTANGLTVLGTSTFRSAASGSTSAGTISSMGVFTSSSEEMTLDGAITSTGSLSSSGLTVKQGNTTTISTTSGGAITAAGKIKGGSLEATGSVYSRSLYVRDANANNIFSVESSGTVEAKALQIKSSGSVIAGIDSTGLITGKKLSLVDSADNMIRVSYGTQYADITPAEYKITDSSSSSAAHLTSSYLSVFKSSNTAKLGIDSSGNIEFIGSVTSGTSAGNSIWPTVTRDTTANTITKGRVYAITLGDLKTMIQDSSGTYSTKYGNWSVMLTRTV